MNFELLVALGLLLTEDPHGFFVRARLGLQLSSSTCAHSVGLDTPLEGCTFLRSLCLPGLCLTNTIVCNECH